MRLAGLPPLLRDRSCRRAALAACSGPAPSNPALAKVPPAKVPPATYYLAPGDSLAQGVQPTRPATA